MTTDDHQRLGRVFVFGDNIDTDQLAPGAYMKGGIDALAAHCLETARPDFSGAVRPGDILVAGRNFGAGSSREQAAEALLHLGVTAVLAESFAGIFFRNAINLGLPVLRPVSNKDLALAKDGDGMAIDLDASRAQLFEPLRVIPLQPLPDNVRQLLHDGGLIGHLKKRLASAGSATTTTADPMP